MELNREQIIKALECCYENNLSCIDCPFQATDKYLECAGLSLSALALIKELTTKTEAQDIVISELRHRVEKAEHDAERYSKKIKELTEENKAWQKQLITTEEKADKAYYDLACEVENLRANEAQYTLDTHYSVCREEDAYKRAIADTVRKMQEQLKMEIDRFGKKGGFVSKEVVAWFIDQITKEMLKEEEKND